MYQQAEKKKFFLMFVNNLIMGAIIMWKSAPKLKYWKMAMLRTNPFFEKFVCRGITKYNNVLQLLRISLDYGVVIKLRVY